MRDRATLIRWCIVAAVLLASTAALLGVLRDPLPIAAHAEIPADELLAYDLGGARSVTVGLVPRTRELLLTSWCVVPSAAPEERWVYEIEAEWRGAADRVLGRTRLAFESRVSGDASQRDVAAWSVRLAYATDPVTDPRTVRVLIPEFGGERPSRVLLAAGPAAPGRVLVRTTFPEPRGALERDAVEQSLTVEDRAELGRDRASLPFDELSPAFRAAALSHWQRRLDAAGVLGRDYHVERLLIGRGRALPPPSPARPALARVGGGRALAFNLFGVAPVELSGPAGARLSCTDGLGAALECASRGDGKYAVTAGRAGVATTLVVTSPSDGDVPVRATLPREHAAAAIGGVEDTGGDRLELRPAWLRGSYYRLDPEQPLWVDIADGQDVFGVSLRSAALQARATLRASFGSFESKAEVELPPSAFERWPDGSRATDPEELFLQVPPGVQRVALRGDASLLAAPFAYDPEITEDRLAQSFERPLAEGTEFRYAPHDVQRRVSVRSAEHEALERAGRTLELWAQARVVGIEARPPEPEMALRPSGPTVTRHIVQPIARKPGRAPTRVWVTLDRPRRVVIADRGPYVGRALLRYRVAREHLGTPLALVVDGVQALVETPVTSSADIPLMLPPGEHTLALEGLRPGDLALAQVSDAPLEPLVRQRIVYRLSPGRSFDFNVNKIVDVARMLVLAYAEGEASVALSYVVEGRLSHELVAVPSALRGRLEGPLSEVGPIWFWESGQAGRLGELRASLRLGADLSRGSVGVRLTNDGRGPVWLAAILVGQDTGAADSLDRFWALEDE